MKGVVPVSYTHLDVYKRQVQEDGKKINEKTLLYEMKEDSIPFKERVFMRENGMRPQLSLIHIFNSISYEFGDKDNNV